MSFLGVPGARLSYAVRGGAPPLLMVPGAGGDGDVFTSVAAGLAAHYTVVAYDRRGFSRSRLDGPPDDGRRLETDADDARRLIEHLGMGPATVFGANSGGIVALALLARHPDAVEALVPFEPPLMRLLTDGADWIGFFAGVFDRYRQSGIGPALALFREQTFADADRAVMARAGDPRRDERARANAAFWFEHELRQYPTVDPDLEAIRVFADRVVPAVGRQSRGYPCYAATAELGRRLGRAVAELPGGHAGFVAEPAAFAHALRDILTGAAETG